MTIWFTSDTHFSHANIIKYCNRPFKDANEMNNTIINNWNNIVKPKDTIYHLGDFCFEVKGYPSFDELMDSLEGKIILVKGNHDHDNSIIKDIILVHKKDVYHLIHDPLDGCERFNICGHIHEKWRLNKINGKKFINVGVDVNNFTPISFDEVIKGLNEPDCMFETKRFRMEDNNGNKNRK